MPVQYRDFYLKRLINVKEKEQAEIDKSQGKMSEHTPTQKIARGPAIDGKHF